MSEASKLKQERARIRVLDRLYRSGNDDGSQLCEYAGNHRGALADLCNVTLAAVDTAFAKMADETPQKTGRGISIAMKNAAENLAERNRQLAQANARGLEWDGKDIVALGALVAKARKAKCDLLAFKEFCGVRPARLDAVLRAFVKTKPRDLQVRLEQAALVFTWRNPDSRGCIRFVLVGPDSGDSVGEVRAPFAPSDTRICRQPGQSWIDRAA